MKVEVPNWLCFKCVYCVPSPEGAKVVCIRLWKDEDPPSDYLSTCPGYASKVSPLHLDWFKHNMMFGFRRGF